MEELANMPIVQFFASPACNLNCAYCSQRHLRRSQITDDAFADMDVQERIRSWPPTHFYLSGGEPFHHSGLAGLLRCCFESGHKVSFDTNGVIDVSWLEKQLQSYPEAFWGFFNITHHLLCDVSLEEILRVTMLLKKYGIRHFVKYIAVPNTFERIKANIDKLKEASVGVAISVFQTYKDGWKGRQYPRDYTDDEVDFILHNTTLRSHGFQLTGGFLCKQIKCRGGHSYVAYNMRGQRELNACCHSVRPLAWSETAMETMGGRPRTCCEDVCSGDLMIIFGIQGMTDDIEQFAMLCDGDATPVGAESIIEYCSAISSSWPLKDTSMLQRIMRCSR